MSAVIFLDSSPLGVLSNPRQTARVTACWHWLRALQAAGRRVIVPEIADYEVRREFIRASLTLSVSALDQLAQQLEYLPLNTAAMRLAADLWAQARQQGQPTAGDNTIDGDVILAAQALSLGVPDVLIATNNIGHIARFVPAEVWQNIPP